MVHVSTRSNRGVFVQTFPTSKSSLGHQRYYAANTMMGTRAVGICRVMMGSQALTSINTHRVASNTI